ncbi:MAG: FAD-dependent oxidoreductase [Anaeromyxobacteraceae bacterium]
MERQHAVVVGASIGGLLAARVLSEHFERVTILERDALPGGPEVRKAVPQGAHVHVLLPGGSEVLAALFPGFHDTLRAAGAVETDVASRLAWYQFGVWKMRRSVGLSMWQLTRPLLEWSLRTRVTALDNVALRTGTRVGALLATTDGGRVIGVRVATGDLDAEELRADLVVDASGRGSRAPEWLSGLGRPRVEEDEIRMWLGYSSRFFRRTKDPGWNAAYVIATPPAHRAGLLFAVEGGRWLCTLSSWLRDYPPTDEAAFMAFARDLPVSELHEAIRDAEPLGEIHSHRFACSVRRRFEKLRMPEGFVVLGDALSSFSPIYGQGMTVSALEAQALRACLRETSGVTARFQRSAARIVDGAWLLAASEDLRYPEVEGARPPLLGVLHRYVERAHRLAGRDDVVLRRLCEVLAMAAPPTVLFRPATAVRILARRPAPRAQEGRDLPAHRLPAR